MNEITRQGCREIRQAAEDALKVVEDDLGVSVEIGNGRFNDESVTFKITFHVERPEGTKTTAEMQFEALAPQFGLKVSDLHRKFRSGHKVYEITGLKATRHKYPINATDVLTGKPFKFAVHTVKAGLLPI